MKHFRSPLPPLVVLILGWQLFATKVLAQWSTNPAINNAICTQTGNQSRNEIISDGSGGAIISWVNGGDSITIFAQRVNSNGINAWATNGVQVCPNTYNSNLTSKMVSDDNGGAIIVYQTFPSPGVSYFLAQRINANGVLQWSSPGVVLAPLFQTTVTEVTSDGSGGAIVSWMSYDSSNVYVQRVNASGQVQWGTGGIPVTSDPFAQTGIKLQSDGSGGAIIAWMDYRNGDAAIYAQKVNGAGAMQWTANGVPVTTPLGGSYDFQIIHEAGGAIISFQSPLGDIYAQKLNASGLFQWTANGALICAAANAQLFSQLASDGFGGAIITWEDERNGGSQGPRDIYAQRIDSIGSIVWPLDGVGICQTVTYDYDPTIAADGIGGATIVWTDGRSGGVPVNYDIYAQRINAGGTVLWTTNGVAVSTAALSQELPLIINDGNNGTIITWQDSRNFATTGPDIFAQRVRSDGTLGGATGVDDDDHSLPTTFTLEQNYPNPFNPATTISFGLPSTIFVSLKVFDVLGKEVSHLLAEELAAGMYSQQWKATGLASGVYFYRLQAGKFVETRKLILLR